MRRRSSETSYFWFWHHSMIFLLLFLNPTSGRSGAPLLEMIKSGTLPQSGGVILLIWYQSTSFWQRKDFSPFSYSTILCKSPHGTLLLKFNYFPSPKSQSQRYSARQLCSRLLNLVSCVSHPTMDCWMPFLAYIWDLCTFFSCFLLQIFFPLLCKTFSWV